MIMNLYDDYEKRPRRSLNSFVEEWFLKRFGLFTYSEMVLKIYSIA